MELSVGVAPSSPPSSPPPLPDMDFTLPSPPIPDIDLDFTLPSGDPGVSVSDVTPKRSAADILHEPPAPRKPKSTRRMRPDSLDLLTEGPTPPPEALQAHPEDVKDAVKKHWVSLKSYSHESKVQSVYNIRLTKEDISQKLHAIFARQSKSFKVNASIGSLLRNSKTDEVRYFHSSLNNWRLYDQQIQINTLRDFETFVERTTSRDFNESCNPPKESSEWVCYGATNLTVYVNHLDYAIGADADAEGPPQKGAISIPSPPNLCFFACLAAHLDPGRLAKYLKPKIKRPGHKPFYKRDALKLYKKYSNTPSSDYSGVTMDEMGALEQTFGIGIRVYETEYRNGKKIASLVRAENPNLTALRMVLHLSHTDGEGYHFSYVYDLKKYASFYKCNKCGQLWSAAWPCARHEFTCDTITREVYPVGHFKPKSTVFDKLQDVGIEIPQEKRYFKHFITYDFEAFMKKSDQFEAEHVPVSFSLCSNIPGLTEPLFYAHPDPDQLVKTFLDYLNAWSDRSYAILRPKYEQYFAEIDEKARAISAREPDPDKEPDKEPDKVPDKGTDKDRNNYARLSDELESWLRKVPTLGYNSQKYDINLIKTPFVKILNGLGHAPNPSLDKPEVLFTKKNNAMMCVETAKLKMLDITNYLAPSSYSEYLAAFHIEEKKGFFPYEFVKSFEHLTQTRQLPPYEAFYSNLNACNTLDCGEGELAGRKRWSELEMLWRERGMSDLLAFLEWYNNLDVSSFVEAIKKQFSLFREHFGIDIFKEGISLPGISLKYAMTTTDAKFALYGEKFKWLYKELRESITGGPSIIFSRHQEKDVTKIRHIELGHRAETCKSVVGVDANSLYLWAWSQDFPAGNFEVRTAPEFTKVKQPRHGYSLGAIEWLEAESKSRGVKIVHKLNSCGEIIIGARKLAVDGFLAAENTIFEFHGCYYHAHETCNATRMDETHPYYGKTFAEVREFTREKIVYFKQLGYTVFEKWECEWRKETIRPTAHVDPTKLSQSQILDMVRDGSLFGLVKVDIHTPDWLRSRLAEFPPIFKNCEVSKSDIGQFMGDYCEKAGALKKPSRLLISSFHADRVLLVTPLLKYYLQLGLVVTKVHFTVHFPEHKPCFKLFADTVCDARRRGDLDPDSDILASTFKLVGNSAYGRVCLNKAKQTATKYADGARATYLINNKRFRACRRIDKDTFEVELYKDKHIFDLPLHLGVFTYQLAKLRMLEWHYDFMQKFLPRRMYELAEMDTDSSYFGLARSSIDDCVPLHLKRQYFADYDLWFPMRACAAHKNEFVETKMRNLEWVPAECCRKASKYDKRTPGKFKIEFNGDGIVALCSKTYICFGDKETKLSCKGIQKKRNFERLTKAAYLGVLRNQRPGYGINKGFKAQCGKIHTYTQKRYGISYMYCKRRVLNDGVTTVPLDL